MVVRDNVAYLLNDIINCKKVNKDVTVAMPVSKLMLEVLRIMKNQGYVKDYKVEQEKFKKVIIEIGKVNECKAIKPRFYVKKDSYDKYVQRFLPARGFGILIVSTNQGLMTHQDAMEKGLGGSLVAYCF